MLALRKTTAALGADLVDVEVSPTPGAGRVTVAVAAAGICGSDIHAYEWTPGYAFMTRHMPVTLGHEFAGTIRAVGEGVTALSVGDRVTCWPTVPCRACAACEADRPQDCPNRSIVGLHADGGFAEQVVVPATNCRRLPDDLPLPVAALTEPLAVAVNAVDVAEIGPGSRVAVLGPGPIGLFVAFVAQQRGAHVLLVGLDDGPRLALAHRIGIGATADLTEGTLDEAVRETFRGEADRVIEATGAARSVTEGLAVLRSGGVMVVAGIHSGSLALDLTAFVRSKKQLRAAHDTTARAFDEAIRLLSAHAGTLEQAITHRHPLGEAPAAFDIARSRQAMKVLLLPEVTDAKDTPR